MRVANRKGIFFWRMSYLVHFCRAMLSDKPMILSQAIHHRQSNLRFSLRFSRQQRPFLIRGRHPASLSVQRKEERHAVSFRERNVESRYSMRKEGVRSCASERQSARGPADGLTQLSVPTLLLKRASALAQVHAGRLIKKPHLQKFTAVPVRQHPRPAVTRGTARVTRRTWRRRLRCAPYSTSCFSMSCEEASTSVFEVCLCVGETRWTKSIAVEEIYWKSCPVAITGGY